MQMYSTLRLTDHLLICYDRDTLPARPWGRAAILHTRLATLPVAVSAVPATARCARHLVRSRQSLLMIRPVLPSLLVLSSVLFN